MIIGILGLPRNGKTLLSTIITYCASKRGMDIYTNYKLDFPNTKSKIEMVNPNDLIDFKLNNCLLDLDEIGTIVDARLNSKGGRLLSYFIMQTGKRDVHLVWTSQLLSMVDGRLTDVTNILINAEKTPIGFKYKMIKTSNFKVRSFRIPFSYAEKFYPMYDTKQVINPTELNNNDLNFDEVVKDVESSPIKNSFVTLIRTTKPWMPESTAKAVYDYIKQGDIDKAKRVLRLERPTVQRIV